MRKDNQIVVFRTGSLVEFDSVTGALEDAGIPYFTREDSSAGLRLATPVSPSVGPGTWWMVVVPCGAVEDARTIISAFPFSDKTSPCVWDFQPSKRVQIGWKIYAGGVLLFCLLIALWELIQEFR